MNKKKEADKILERLKNCNPQEVKALMIQLDNIRNQYEPKKG